MKVWIKLLIGSILGFLLAVFLPDYGGGSYAVLKYISTLVMHIGRYTVFPLVFFSLAMAAYELKEERRLLRTFLRSSLYLLMSSGFFVLLGGLSIYIFSPERIRIANPVGEKILLPHVSDLILQVFPKNMFAVFFNGGDFLLPVFFLAMFIGINFTFDRLVTKPSIQLFESLANIFYHMVRLVVELLGIGIIAVTAFLVFQIKSVGNLTDYKQLFLVLSIDVVVIVFGIYPLIIYLLGNRENPYKTLYAMLGPVLAAFVSGDSYFSLPFLLTHGKENLGIPRKLGAFSYPLYAIFGRSGTAMVTSISFIVIIKSYTNLGIPFLSLFWIIAFSFLVSFLLGSVPGSGVLVAMASLSSWNVSVGNNDYLIMQPVIPFLICFGVLLDVIASIFNTYIVAYQESMLKGGEIKDYI